MAKWNHKIKESKWFKFMSNKYVLITLLFAIWMLAFDSNNYFIHQELNQEIDEIEGAGDNYLEKTLSDKEALEKLKDTNELEKYGREEYFLKKEDEDIFIITHQDSIDQ